MQYRPGDVPTDHRWLSEEYVAEWAATANDAPHRAAIFDAFVSQLRALAAGGEIRVFELGSGPGYLAEQICTGVRVASYHAVDISPQMHAIARSRLEPWKGRVEFVEVDFRVAGWQRALDQSFDAAVTLQAVHELRHADLIPDLYRSVSTRLRPGGVFLVADLVNGPELEPRAHQLTVAEHLRTLTDAGFVHAECVVDLGRFALMRAEQDVSSVGSVPP
jgi:SAM-dependent methyltransferase